MKQAPVGLMSIHLSSRRSVARRSNHVEPHGTVAIARHYIKDLVYGATDGIITTFAVVAGVTGGALSHSAVLIVGAANLAADGLSMAVGNFLAIRAHESAREADDLPEEESRHFALPKPFALEIFLARVTRVRVLPQDLLLLASDGQLFLEGFVRFAQQYALREGGVIRHCADDGRLLLSLPERTLAVTQPCVYLGAGSGHFQWMFESLARLWAIEQQDGLANLPLIVQPSLTRWQEELLQLLGYAAERRIEVPADAMLECRELHAASMVSAGHFISPVAIQYLRRSLARRVAPASDAPRRIYLSRQGAASRRLANEAELLPLLARHGFALVHVDAMGAAEQLALFQSAEFILGVEGAALVNLVVAPAHARVGVIVAQGLYQPRHYYISAPIGHDFTYLCAQPVYASNSVLAECDMTLAPEVLLDFLDGCRAA